MFNTDQIELAARRVLDDDGENAKAKLTFIKAVIAELERRAQLVHRESLDKPAERTARPEPEERAAPVNLDRPKPARANPAAMADAADAVAAKWAKKLG
jgi:hypothetical protein